jgi:predicted transcriptional regulator
MSGLTVEIRATGIRREREQRGVSRRALALMTGISYDRLCALEVGWERANVYRERSALMRALDAGFEELFTIAVR